MEKLNSSTWLQLLIITFDLYSFHNFFTSKQTNKTAIEIEIETLFFSLSPSSIRFGIFACYFYCVEILSLKRLFYVQKSNELNFHEKTFSDDWKIESSRRGIEKKSWSRRSYVLKTDFPAGNFHRTTKIWKL